jgi:hypothetical protein
MIKTKILIEIQIILIPAETHIDNILTLMDSIRFIMGRNQRNMMI